MLNPVKNLMRDNDLEGSVSVISDEITITGTVTSSGNLIINGNVDGEINCESLEIGPSGVVTGTVKAGQCLLAGKLEGKLSARTVNIASTGDLNGRLSYGKLEIETGANIELKLRKTKQLSDTSVENSEGNEEQ
jgi:cytoskeletal protein CcmA (bactofilin family)